MGHGTIKINGLGYTNTLGGLKGTWLLSAVVTIASTAFWLYGYDMSVMGALVTEDSFLSVFPEMKNASAEGIVIAAFEIGAFFGSISCMEVGDRLGRRLTVWVGMMFMIAGGVLQTSAWSVAQLTVGRVISGIGVGTQVATLPSWLSECAPPKTQGRWVMLEGGIQIIGLACGQVIGYGFFFTKGQIQWRAPVGIQLVPATIVFSLILLLPESPRWLVKHKMFKEARNNLQALRNWSDDDPRLITEYESIMASFEAQHGEARFAYRDFFKGGKTQTFRRMMLGVFMQAAQQLTGINMVSTYANQILASTFNFQPGMSHLIAAMGGIEYAICTLFSGILIEGLGRRKTFMWTLAGNAACFVAISVLLANGGRNGLLAATGLLYLFNSIFALAWVGGPYLYSAEIAPLFARSQCNAVANSSNWLFTFLVVMTLPKSFASIGWKTYIYYACFNAALVPIIYLFLIETKGRSLEELDVIFAAPGNPVKNEKRMPHDISIHDARQILGLEDHDSADSEGSGAEKQEPRTAHIETTLPV